MDNNKKDAVIYHRVGRVEEFNGVNMDITEIKREVEQAENDGVRYAIATNKVKFLLQELEKLQQEKWDHFNRLEKENERYKEVLKYYASLKPIEKFDGYWDISIFAREALHEN